MTFCVGKNEKFNSDNLVIFFGLFSPQKSEPDP